MAGYSSVNILDGNGSDAEDQSGDEIPRTIPPQTKPRKLFSFIASRASSAKAKLQEQFESTASRKAKAPTTGSVMRIERGAEISANAMLKRELDSGKISQDEYNMLVDMNRRTLEQNQEVALADHRAMYGDQD
jgi:hypothetical protein